MQNMLVNWNLLLYSIRKGEKWI